MIETISTFAHKAPMTCALICLLIVVISYFPYRRRIKKKLKRGNNHLSKFGLDKIYEEEEYACIYLCSVFGTTCIAIFLIAVFLKEIYPMMCN